MEVGLKGLEAVLAVARRGSFRAAALDLGMSTTALSHTIARLEATLGVRLFNRTTRSVSTSDAGRAFVARIDPAVVEIRAAMETVQSQRLMPSGLLRINASVQGAREIAPLVLAFLRQYPQMQVDLVTEGRLVDIVAEGFDLGLRPADLVPRDMIALPLGPPQPLAVVASPGWVAAHGTPRTLADLPPQRLPPRAPAERRPLPLDLRAGRRGLASRRPRPPDPGRGRHRPHRCPGRRGIGFFIEQDVADDIVAGRLVRLLDDWTPPRAGFSLYYPGRRNPSAGFKAFLAMARDAAAQDATIGR